MRVEWNVGIGERATSTTTHSASTTSPSTTTSTSATGYVCSSNGNALLLPDVRREGNGEISIPFGETALMQPQCSHPNGNYFACPSSTAVSALSSQSNGTSTHSASSTLAVGLSLTQSSREEPQQQQQIQPPHQVTINSQQTAIPGLVSSDLSSSVEQSAHESNNSYKGIFLVDGLGHGVRIDNSQRIGGSPLAASNTNTSAADPNPCLNFCGLPTLMTSAAANDMGMAMNIDTNNVNVNTTTCTSPSTSASADAALVTPSYPLNPVCIQINANNPSPSISNNFTPESTIATSNGRVPVRYDVSSVNINQLSHNQNQSTSVTPVRVTCNSDVSLQSPVNNVPNSNSNVADFSCSPATNVSLFLPFSSNSPQQDHTDPVAGPITISTPHSSPNTNLVERTLISTEAQTEDMPVLVPPPLPQRNREQRKRERRERRREANIQHSSNNNHDPNSSYAPREHSASAQHSQRHNNSNARDVSNPGAHAQTHNHNNEEQSEFSRHPASPVHMSHFDSANVLSYGIRSNLDNVGLPDLLNLPPPYTTLPQHCERRPTMGTVPLAMISPHPHPIPLLPPPQIMAPPTCLQAPPQPVRYHFSPTNTRASRRSMRATRGMPYASEEEPKSCCGMSTSQAVSIRWFIIVIAVIGICCTVAGTALGAARSAGKEHLTLSLLMIGVGVVLLTVSAVAWRLTANETGTSCRAMLGFARSGSSRGDGGAEPNRRFVPRLAPSYGRPHHPYAAMMYPDFQYRPPPPSYQASMQEYRLRLLLLERSNPTIAAAASLHSPAALTMFPPPPAYRPYHGAMRPPPTGTRNDTDCSRPPSYRSRSSGNSGAEVTNTVHSAIDPGNGQLHIVMDSPHHSRDPSLISYLSQQSILENGSGVSGGGGNPQGGNHNVTTTVVTVMQTVSVGMGLELDMSALSYDPNASSSGHNDDNKEYPNQSQVGDPDKKALALGSKGNVNSNDGNLVRIVQTTDSSQVIGRDSVIVTVSGSNHSLWSQALHHPPNNDYSNSNISDAPQRNNLSENGEVQILAHL